MWEQTCFGDWGEVEYGPHRAAVDKEMSEAIEHGRHRIQELFRDIPPKRFVRHMYLYHLRFTKNTPCDVYGGTVPYPEVTRTGEVPWELKDALHDIGECLNHGFGWGTTLAYEFYHIPSSGNMRLVVTNTDYHNQRLAMMADQAALTLFGLLRRKKIPVSMQARYLIRKWISTHSEAWEPIWEALASPIEKRIKAE